MRGYDQWKTASPFDEVPDPIEVAEAVVKDAKWALMNWEQKPSAGWDLHIDKLIETVEMLITYIVEET